jgi:hypothetical protein
MQCDVSKVLQKSLNMQLEGVAEAPVRGFDGDEG